LSEIQGMGLKITKDVFSEDNAVRIMSKKIGGGAKGDIPKCNSNGSRIGRTIYIG